MRITSGNHSIQLFQAQQAFQAKKPVRPEPDHTPAELEVANVQEELPTISQNVLGPSWKARYQEIQQIAQKAGFVGLTERDIQRAYAHGESLLADYRV